MNRLTLMMAGVCALAVPTALPAADAAAATETAAAGAGLKAVRDAATGRLRAPTAQEMAKMSAGEPATTEAEIEVRVAGNGMKSARLPASMLVSVEARRDAQGQIRTEHDRAGLNPAAMSALPTE